MGEDGFWRRRVRRGRSSATAVLALAALLAVAACGSSGSEDSERPALGGPKAMRTSLALAGIDDAVAYDQPLELSVSNGTIDSVELEPAQESGDTVAGELAGEGTTWRSAGPLQPGASYTATVVATDRLGDQHTLVSEFTVANVPDSNRLTLTMQPSNGSTVGVGAPITVTFDQEVTEREAVESAMRVSSDPQVEGSWRWLSSTQVHFRPKEYWPAGTKVRLNLDLNGVKAGDDLWGGRSYELSFTVGSARIAKVDAAAHTMSIVEDGRTAATWATSLGSPEFATRNGTYIVLEKFDTRRMTSCNANITCDPGSPEYYDLEVDWSVRLTWSGTFVHSAPWSEGSQGSANVSHGCINLSAANGRTFFNNAKYGDVVTVTNSTRDAADLVQRGDPGMADWNLSWDQYVAGSALGKPVTTSPL